MIQKNSEIQALLGIGTFMNVWRWRRLVAVVLAEIYVTGKNKKTDYGGVDYKTRNSGRAIGPGRSTHLRYFTVLFE